MTIAHNTINQADGLHGGAIVLTRGWFAGPSPGTWDLEDNTLIFGNTISNVPGAPRHVVTGPLAYTTSPYKNCPNDSVPGWVFTRRSDDLAYGGIRQLVYQRHDQAWLIPAPVPNAVVSLVRDEFLRMPSSSSGRSEVRAFSA